MPGGSVRPGRGWCLTLGSSAYRFWRVRSVDCDRSPRPDRRGRLRTSRCSASRPRGGGLRNVRASGRVASSSSDSRSRAPDLVILDVGLPDADGRDVCQALRAQGIQTPVLFLTARDALTDRVTGFSAGGDDYVSKPFAFAELVARVRALLRRAATDIAAESGSLRLDPVAHADVRRRSRDRAYADRVPAAGAARDEPRCEAVRRSDLIRTAWPHGAQVRPNTLDAYIARLRRKLEPFPTPRR